MLTSFPSDYSQPGLWRQMLHVPSLSAQYGYAVLTQARHPATWVPASACR
jgi:hypothetical protein